MSVQDRWYKRGPNSSRVKTSRHGRGKRWQVRWYDPLDDCARSESYSSRIVATQRDAEIREAVYRFQPELERYEHVVYGRPRERA